MTASTHPRGPKGHWFWGNLPEVRQDVLGFLQRTPNEYGDVVSLRFGSYRAVLLSSPKWIEKVLVSENDKFQKPPRFRRIVRAALGDGLFNNDGPSWERQRALLQRAFQSMNAENYADTAVAITRNMISQWRNHETRDLHEDMKKLTFAIRGKTLMGIDPSDEFQTITTSLNLFLEYFAKNLGNPLSLPLWFPTPGNLRMARAMRRSHDAVSNIIKEDRSDTKTNHDLLSILLGVRGAGTIPRMTDRQLRDEVATLFLAGSETVTNTMAWTWYLIARHPEVEDKLLAELADVLGDRNPGLSDLPRLQYTQHILFESMRLYPQAFIIGRKSLVPVTFGSYEIPAGVFVILNQWFLCRNPEWFDDPERFDPGRWATGLAKRIPRFAYFPFGGGPRSCIGKPLAMIEMPLLVATIAQQYHMTLVSGSPVQIDPSITLRPKNGIKATVSIRATND